MCGIVGLWNLDGKRLVEGEMDAYVDALSHRGPDGRGVYRDGSLYLGHRRLSIIDLSDAAIQPFVSHCGRFAITFNGEIYNYIELKKELESYGYAFYTTSDTEVALLSYIHFGADCQKKFNGMWAFAIWDRDKKELFISRDRFGVKPLYYCASEKQFAFSSEIKAFLQLQSFDRTFNPRYFEWAFQDARSLEDSPECLFKNVKKLRPGHFLTITREGVECRKWWNTLDELVQPPSTFREQAERFKELFFDACALRMRSDVDVAFALSGGLDSSSAICTACQLYPEKIPKALFAHFPGTEQDESEYVHAIQKERSIELITETISCHDLVSNIDTILYSLEDVFDLPIGPFLLYKGYQKQGVKVSIEGHGADELMGGYHFQLNHFLERELFPVPHPKAYHMIREVLKKMGGSRLFSHREAFKGAMKRMVKKSPALYRILSKRVKDERLMQWIYPSRGERDLFLYRYYRECEEKARGLSPMNQELYLDFHHYSLPILLRNYDKMSMASGIEVRSPFLDYRLVTYLFSLSWETKLGEVGTKRILREAMQGILPEKIRTRQKKLGFASPLANWMKKGMEEFILDTVKSSHFLTSSFWNGNAIKKFVETSIEREELGNLRLCWEFIIASRLTQIYQNPLRNYESIEMCHARC